MSSGTSVVAYLLIPFATVETTESGLKPSSEIKRSNASWKIALTKQGYIPVDLSTPFEEHPRLLETFKKARNLEDGKEGEELRKLCNSFEKKDSLSSEEEVEAKRWCVNPRKVGDILKGRGRKYIYTLEHEIEVWDNEKTRNLARQYMQNKVDNLKMATAWNNTNLLTITEENFDKDLETFKGACLNALDAKSFEDDLEQKIKKAEQWCTEE
ncbi:hypothetical protein [Candidatus Mycoplasma haematobovis]|uniref:hypothetical protein n=1 Tax=Candidatus Mycoplasma haematobovis TaxID=432608 RepID=UPI00164FEE47|nr:hypothetical protein [Candidatus Mycoplasma haematobovis]